jgi:hypothetical protein
MYYVIGADGKMNGPLSVADVHQWLAEGRASKYSRVRREGEETWQPLSSIPELAPRPPAPAPAPPVAAAATRTTDVRLESPQAIATEYLRREVSLDVGRCVARGWALVRGNPLLLITAAGMAWSVLIGASLLPTIGWIVGMVVNSPMLGGLYFVYIRSIRGERAALEDVLAGFRQAFVPLLVAGLLCGGLTTLALLPPAGLLSATVTPAGRLPSGAGAAALTISGLLLLSVPALYLAVSYLFVVPLVMDKRMEVWTAMEVSRRVIGRQWWTVFALAMVSTLMVLVGLLAFGIGVIVAVPVATAGMMYAYEDLFGHA